MKKKLALLLAMMLAVGIFAGCGSKEAADAPASDAQEESAEAPAGDGPTIEVCVSDPDDKWEAMQSLAKAFTEETGINVDLVNLGDDYEGVMKTRMASGDMPDVWYTHGYSTTRYREYADVLNDEEWASRMMDTIEPLMIGTDGNIRALPVTQSMYCVLYNKDVLEAAGVDPASIVNWDDFKEACLKIRDSGKVPVYFGGKEAGCFGLYYDIAGQSYYVPEDSMYPSASELQNGTFDWDTKGACVFEDLVWLVENDCINEDVFSADETAQITALANGDCAFDFWETGHLTYAYELNPDANLGVMPAPATTATGPATYSPGEGLCLAVWKDSEVNAEARQFLEFMARDESLITYMEASGQISGIKIEAEIDDPGYLAIAESQEIWAGKSESYNVLDRDYITVDIWISIVDGTMEVVANPTQEGIDTAVAMLRDDYQAKHALLAEE